MDATKQRIEFAGVRFSADAVCDLIGGRVYTVIPHSEVRRITLRHGPLSAHPIIQLVTGALLASAGIPVLMHFIGWIRHGGTMFTAESLLLTFPTVGVIMVFTAMRRGYYLRVEKERGRAKLPFDAHADLDGIRALLRAASSTVTFPIEIDPGIPR